MRLRLAFLVASLTFGCGSAGPASTERSDFRGGTAYEVFVRSFADSDGDGVGDLKGLTAHLDYLADLGVEAVWLMPIFPSPSYHGYDVTDYRAIHPAYGTLADFDAFLAAAHQRGIAVLLDFVLNHASSQHPWFLDSVSLSSDKRGDFMWRDADPGWHKPDGGDPWVSRGGAYYYAYFCDCMPDWNLGNAAVASELTDAMKFWLSRGVDGFRLDAVRYFFESDSGNLVDQPQTHAFLRKLRSSLGKAVLVAEAWAPLEVQATYYGAGDEVQLAFSFDLADALMSSLRSGSAGTVTAVLARTEAAFPGKQRNFEAPFLSNHDQVRVMRQLGGDAAAARVAAATLFALPGTPFVYYGEELGMQGGGGPADQNKRTFFRWTAGGPGYGFTTGTPWFTGTEAAGVDVASESADAASLLNEYRSLIKLRREQPALWGGATTRPTVAGGGAGVLALLRTAAAGDRVLFVANLATTAAGPFTVDVAGTPAVLASEGLGAAPAGASGGLAFADLASRGYAFLRLD
jgi:alpha-amylase